MGQKIFTILTIAFLLGHPTNGRVKDPDEDKAYEFGFTIEGMQHRHEKKDVNGIIQGEFGFITADGVYHVTVYATDENGNFKILSMKNIKVSPPLDGSPDFGSTKYSSIPKGPQPQKAPQSPPPKASLQPLQVQKRTNNPTTRAPFTTQPTLKPACAGCGYVTTSKKPPLNQNSDSKYPNQNFGGGNYPSGDIASRFGGVQSNPQEGEKTPISFGRSQADGNFSPRFGDAQSTPSQVGENTPFGNQPGGNFPPRFGGSLSPQSPSYVDSFSNPQNEQNEVLGPSKQPEHSHITHRNPEPPVQVVDNLIKIPGIPDIPIKDKYPGMVEGLPAGIEQKDITDILYRFNWTVGFQGHYETGYKNGAKVGGYFVNGSDGINRIVTYVADEFGYRPKVKIINVGLNSPDTPKDDKTFVLQSFEFVWYPVK